MLAHCLYKFNDDENRDIVFFGCWHVRYILWYIRGNISRRDIEKNLIEKFLHKRLHSFEIECYMEKVHKYYCICFGSRYNH